MATTISKREIPEFCGNKTIRMICDYKHRRRYHIIFSILLGLCSLVICHMASKDMPTPFSTVFFLVIFMIYIPIFVLFWYIGYYLFILIQYVFVDRKKLHNWIEKNPNDERIKWMKFEYYFYAQIMR